MDYKKILEGVVNIINTTEKSDIGFANICAYIGENCPEFKESEDERIRKKLISFVKNWDKCGIVSKYTSNANDIKRILAWLEKQGNIDKASYEIAEKEKYDFVGDGFIKCYADFQDFKEGETYWLEYVGNDNYNVRSDNLLGKTYHITPCQLYTIFKKMTWLEKQGQTFTKKDVDDAYLKGVTNTKNEIEKQYEANYQIRKDIATFIFNYRGDIKDRAKWMNYLGIKVSFAEMQGEQKPYDQRKECKDCQFNYASECKGYCALKRDEQKPADWSEEDETRLTNIIIMLKEGASHHFIKDDITKAVDWLKSLRPQSQWKPSDEQVKALHDLNLTGNISYAGQGQVLIELYNDLKKLAEE